MNAPIDIHHLASDLKDKGSAFAIATVVRTVSVTSAKAGAKAIILENGTITGGWIGGGCARSAVLKAAQDALSDGTPRLISVQPEDLLEEQGVAAGDERDGVEFARNLCPSQGSMDIFVEAVRPKPELVIFGSSPVAVALAGLAKPLGYSVIASAVKGDPAIPEADVFTENFAIAPTNAHRFIVVSTQGRGDGSALKSALTSNADFVAFVGSFKKAASLKQKLIDEGMPAAQFDNLKAPAGLDIKAITPEEIALSILAEITQRRRAGETIGNASIDTSENPSSTAQEGRLFSGPVGQ
ncbi:MAG: XdhC/CoxI family protein [Pseudomonadota bacterium]